MFLKRSFFVIFAVVLLANASTSLEAKEKWVRSKDGLKALMQLAKDRGNMEKEYRKEEKSFDKISQAVEKGVLKEGYQAFEVRKKFGDPVVIVPERGTDREIWLYKPNQGWFIDNIPQVALTFGPDKKLIKAEYTPAKTKEEIEEEASIWKILFNSIRQRTGFGASGEQASPTGSI